MTPRLTPLVLLATAALLAGCGAPEPTPTTDGPLPVVATTSIVADLARQLGGDRVRVVALMGPGVDPHLYRAREGDIRRLQGAALILFNGLHLEAKLADVLERMPRAVAVTEAIPQERLLAPPDFADSFDPHIWLDVSLWRAAAERTRDALAEVDPEGTPHYAARTPSYLSELAELDEYARQQVAETPERSRVLLTAHDTFGYLGRAYGIEVRGQLYADALGDPDGPAGTYLGMVRHTVDTIVGTLAPAAR